MSAVTVQDKRLTKSETVCPNEEDQYHHNDSYCWWSQGCAKLLTLFHTYTRVEEPSENIDDKGILLKTVKELRWRGEHLGSSYFVFRRAFGFHKEVNQWNLAMAGKPKNTKWDTVRRSRKPILKMCNTPLNIFSPLSDFFSSDSVLENSFATEAMVTSVARKAFRSKRNEWVIMCITMALCTL